MFTNNCTNPLKLSDKNGEYKVNKPLDQSGEYVDKKVADEMLNALRVVKDYVDYPHTHKGTAIIRKAVEKAIKTATEQ